MSLVARLALIAAALVAAGAASAPARADGLNGGISTSLVRGGAALPHFDTSFPIETSGPSSPALVDQNLEISLTSPDHGVLRFLFSPRMLSGETYGFGPTVTGNYVGLAWNIFDSNRLFGSIALTGSVNRQALDEPAPAPRFAAPTLSMHSTLEFGYAFDAQQSLSLALDHDSSPNYFGDFFRLRYGYHF